MGCGQSALQEPHKVSVPHKKQSQIKTEADQQTMQAITEDPKDNIFATKKLEMNSNITFTNEIDISSQVSIKIIKKPKNLVLIQEAESPDSSENRQTRQAQIMMQTSDQHDETKIQITTQRFSGGGEFSFNNSPQNQNQPGQFLLKLNQKRKEEEQFHRGSLLFSDETPNLNGGSNDWMNFGHAMQNQGVMQLNKIDSIQSNIQEESNILRDNYSSLNSSQPEEKPLTGKTNLLNAIRNKIIQDIQKSTQSTQITSQRYQQIQQNPKFNLLQLAQEIKSLSPIPQQKSQLEDESDSQTGQDLREQLRFYYESQGVTNSLSPIYAQTIDSAKTKDEEELFGLAPIVPINKFQIQPIQVLRTKHSATLQVNYQSKTITQGEPSPVLQNSFVVHLEESRLDLDQYTLRMENMDHSKVLRSGSFVSGGSENDNGPRLNSNVLSPLVEQPVYNKISNFQLVPDRSISSGSSQLMPQTPTYPQWKESCLVNQDSLRNKFIENFDIIHAPITNQQSLIVEVSSKHVEQRHPSFSHLDGLESILAKNDESKIILDSLKPQSKRQSISSHKPIETSILEKSRDEEGNKKINHYVILQELGRGGFGKVRLVYDSLTNQYFAMKIANKYKLKKKLLSRYKSVYTLLEQELAILKKMDHPNIVKLNEVIDDPQNDKLYLILELVSKGALDSKAYWKEEGHIIEEGKPTPQISTQKIRKYVRDFLLGLDYLHNYALIIHRDIKPDNLLIDKDDNLKIADFGVSHMMDDDGEEITGETGTKTFLAPELFLGKQVNGKGTDIWAAGITIYMLAFKQPPFDGKTLDQLKDQVINCKIIYPFNSDPGLCSFIEACLQKDPLKRATLEQLIKNQWVTNNGLEPITQPNYEEKLIVTDIEVRSAITRLTLRGTVRLTAKLKHKLNQSRQRIKSRTNTLQVD